MQAKPSKQSILFGLVGTGSPSARGLLPVSHPTLYSCSGAGPAGPQLGLIIPRRRPGCGALGGLGDKAEEAVVAAGDVVLAAAQRNRGAAAPAITGAGAGVGGGCRGNIGRTPTSVLCTRLATCSRAQERHVPRAGAFIILQLPAAGYTRLPHWQQLLQTIRWSAPAHTHLALRRHFAPTRTTPRQRHLWQRMPCSSCSCLGPPRSTCTRGGAQAGRRPWLRHLPRKA